MILLTLTKEYPKLTKMQNDNQIKIDRLIVKLEGLQGEPILDHREILSVLNAIIERKKLVNTPQERSAYLDFKMMLNHYILSLYQSDYDYDEINVSHIVNKMEGFNPEQKIHLLELFRRQLVMHGYLNESKKLEKPINVNTLKYLSENTSIMNWLKWLSIKCSYKLRYLFYLMLGAFVLPLVILLPAAKDSMVLFVFRQKEYSSNYVLNHIDNVIAVLFNLDQDVSIECTSTFSLLIVVAAKLFFGLFIVNFVFKKITNHIDAQ